MAKQDTDAKRVRRTEQHLRGWQLSIFLLGCWLLCGFFSETAEPVVFLNDRVTQMVGTDSLNAGICAALNLDGSGQLIGLADSGIDRGDIQNLPLDLKGDYGSRPRIDYLESIAGRTVADDPTGHGTHMAGIIVGSGVASSSRYRGVAYGASLYFQALLNSQGEIVAPSNAATLFEPAYRAGVRIHVNGWGTLNNSYSVRTASIDRFITEHPDFLAIFSAGNEGNREDALTAEANSKNALVVGTSQVPRPTVSADAVWADEVSVSSSSGPAADGRIKPELLAPASAVVSVKSSLIESNFPADTAYTILGGSSMAAAVTGGSAAILRQYLSQNDVENPSAALMKALFIQGARKTSGAVRSYGFGILDPMTTILSLQHHLINWEDQSAGLLQGETRRYAYVVENTGTPLTVTLSWTDPVSDAAGRGAQLVNDLDLQVLAPDGTVYYGNDFTQSGVKDDVNNTEQVVIQNPWPGTYTVQVAAADIQMQEAGQDYAVVYGQNIPTQVVASVEKAEKARNDNLILQNGAEVSLTGKLLRHYQSGRPSASVDVEPGSQIYWTQDTAYVLCNRWEEAGIQIIQDDNGILLTSLNSQVRRADYYISDRWMANKNQSLFYNGENQPISQIPNGTGVQAVINPLSQTLYQVEMTGTEVSGRLEKTDTGREQLFLQGEAQPYYITEGTAVYYTNTQVEGAPEARPFGYMQRADVPELIFGMQLEMLVDERTRQVYVIQAQRPTVFARIDALEIEQDNIVLSGNSYALTDQTIIEQNGKIISRNELLPGEWVGGVLRETVEGKKELIALEVVDQVIWGQVLYFGESSRTLYISDQKNQFLDFKLSENSLIMRGRAEAGANTVSEGAWVRIVLNEETSLAERLDIAVGVMEETSVLASFDAERRIMRFASDAQYPVQDTTLFLREGNVVSAENILPGETLQLTLLPGNSLSDVYLARAEVSSNAGQGQLLKNLEAHHTGGYVVLNGTSLGKEIQIYHQDGTLEKRQAEDSGAFAFLVEMQPDEKNLLVSTCDPESGRVDIQKVPIVPMDTESYRGAFTDIAGSLYREEITALKDMDILSGYSDGTFRPDDTISRMSFLVMLVKATGDVEISLEGARRFKDMQDIPWWGLTTASTIWQRGWREGFEDQYMHPNILLTKADAQRLVLNCPGGDKVKFPLIFGNYVTREEAAAIIYRVIQQNEA